jgi:hypothetical protein
MRLARRAVGAQAQAMNVDAEPCCHAALTLHRDAPSLPFFASSQPWPPWPTLSLQRDLCSRGPEWPEGEAREVARRGGARQGRVGMLTKDSEVPPWAELQPRAWRRPIVGPHSSGGSERFRG